MTLPPGRVATFPKATPNFARWCGAPVGKTYRGKDVLDFEGRPAFADLTILWILQNEGWQGVWVDKTVFRTGYWNSSPNGLPQLCITPSMASLPSPHILVRSPGRFDATLSRVENTSGFALKTQLAVRGEIWNLAKTQPGVCLVFCWQDDRVLFAESKRGKRDRTRPSQRLFAESALNIGLPLDSFLFVEWTKD